MKRTPLERKTPMKRTGPITRAGLKELRRTGVIKPKRRRSRQHLRDEYARKYGSEERVQAIKAMPCCVPGCDSTPCDNAHIKGGGMGRKSDWTHIANLCRFHHIARDQVLGSNERFQEVYGISLEAVAAQLAASVKP